MNKLNIKIIEDALATLGETDYKISEFGNQTIMVSRGRKRLIEADAAAFGIVKFDAELLAECPNPEFTTKWVIDSFFITFKENSLVNVDGEMGSLDINLAEPDSLQRFAQAIKSGLKAIDAFYEDEQKFSADGSDQ